MQKKLLAAVVSSLIAGQAMAVTVVDDGTSKFSVGGNIGMQVISQDNGENQNNTGTASDFSRFDLTSEYKLSEATTAFAKGEWGFDTTGDTDETFSNRLGYVGVKNDQMGSLSFGKQWSTYNKVAGWTDMFATTGAQATGIYAGGDGGELGTGRADDALQYNYSINGLNVSAQYQAGDSAKPLAKVRDKGYAFAASYDLNMGLSVGATYNETQFRGNAPKAKAALVAVKYAQGPIYAAASFTKMENLEADYSDANGTELYVSYQLNDSFTVETGYNHLKNDEVDGTQQNQELEYYPVGVVYTTGPVQLSATYQIESSKKADGTDVEDKAILQARYYF